MKKYQWMKNMQTVKLGSRGNDVKTLQQILKITPADGIYGNGTFQKVKEFQKQYNLVQDGIVGPATWRILVSLTNDMYIKAAYKIGCEVAALKAVKIVETGGKAAFIATGKPSILFEGHVFWRELQARGIDPSKYAASNSTILYKTWTKKFYKSGLAEYTRLEQARRINVDAANASASWGMFQIISLNLMLRILMDQYRVLEVHAKIHDLQTK